MDIVSIDGRDYYQSGQYKVLADFLKNADRAVEPYNKLVGQKMVALGVLEKDSSNAKALGKLTDAEPLIALIEKVPGLQDALERYKKEVEELDDLRRERRERQPVSFSGQEKD